MNTVAAFVGRLLLALIFIVSGINKLFDIPSIEAMLAGVGLPTSFALPTALFELLGGLAIALGVMTRLFAILFAGFSLVTILFFHRQFSDPMQATMALKNVAIAGGFLCLFAHSQMRWSYDSMRQRRRHDALNREVELRAREAELRAARAEGRAEIAPVVTTTPDGAVVTPRRWWSI